MKKTPYRTCVICREKAEQEALIRFSKTKQGYKLNSGQIQGRSIYVHRECLSEKNINKLVKRYDFFLSNEQIKEELSKLYE